MLTHIADTLRKIKPSGTFAAEVVCPSEGLRVHVKDVGAIPFPIPLRVAKALQKVAKPAPFGKRDKTLTDRSVRDTWQIAKSRIKVDFPKQVLDGALLQLRDELGLPSEGTLHAVLDKMLVYMPGQFFAPHQDSERSDDMVGSLVLQLPSVSTGGALVIHHMGNKKSFSGKKRGATDFSLLAFYADCRHEVRPVSAGFRVVLTYHLRYQLNEPSLTSKGSPVAPRGTAPVVTKLARQIETHFSSPTAPSSPQQRAELPDRLVYLLDHEYSARSLGWTQLKNGDRLRALALREAARLTDCECYLGLVDVHETWSCDGQESDYYPKRGRSRSSRYDDSKSEDDGNEPKEYALGELCDSEVELRHLVNDRGVAKRMPPLQLSQREMCLTKETVEMQPFESEHEGWMGNYGNSVDRWYHRAAVVIWPKARNFVIQAKQSPYSAVIELEKLIKKKNMHVALEHARSLLPFWQRVANHEKNAALVPKLLPVLAALDDAKVAHALLLPFTPDRLGSALMPEFALLVEQFGDAWAESLCADLAAEPYQPYGKQAWATLLPALFKCLRKHAPHHGAKYATWLLDREIATFERQRKAQLKQSAVWNGDVALANGQVGTALALLTASSISGDASPRAHLIGVITSGATAWPAESIATLLRKSKGADPNHPSGALDLAELHAYATRSLAAKVAQPGRAEEDWSLAPCGACSCDLCKVLNKFLRDAKQVMHRWPLSQDRRQHIHQTIDRQKLPVTHVTQRAGSPYVLVLAKQKRIFDVDLKSRREQATHLAWLKASRTAFAKH
jgi:2OG-Fe(II) oxygenase superfamily